ncbi:hypothetical protein Pelo_16105 [Pelomyxa schiedti]|nr:hypothetical protein Pelo_16105 [Pelomyxa schiedti]
MLQFANPGPGVTRAVAAPPPPSLLSLADTCVWVFGGRKWTVVSYPCLGYIVILNMSELERDCCGGEIGRGVSKVCMINDDEAGVVSLQLPKCNKAEVWCVDLKASFESHRLVVTQKLELSHVGYMFHSKEHRIIAAISESGEWSLKSLQQPQVLCQAKCLLYNINHTNFACTDPARNVPLWEWLSFVDAVSLALGSCGHPHPLN